MLGKLWKIGYNLVIFALIVLALFLVLPVLPIPGNYQVRVVLSGSMEPAIQTGSVVFIKPAESLKVGDVITFTSRGFKDPQGKLLPVTHRIIEVRQGEFETTYATKGDANGDADSGYVRKENIIGKQFFTIPYLGYAIEAARKPYGFMALIMIPALIIIFDEIKKIIGEAKRIMAEKKGTKRVIKLKVEVIE